MNLLKTFGEFINESKLDEEKNIKALNNFNSLDTINKYSEITDKTIVQLADKVSGNNKIVKEIHAKIKTYDPWIKWKAYDIKNNTIEYYSLKEKKIIGGGRRYIISVSIYNYDDTYKDGIGTLSKSIKNISSGWKDVDDDYYDISQIESWEKYFLNFNIK